MNEIQKLGWEHAKAALSARSVSKPEYVDLIAEGFEAGFRVARDLAKKTVELKSYGILTAGPTFSLSYWDRESLDMIARDVAKLGESDE